MLFRSKGDSRKRLLVSLLVLPALCQAACGCIANCSPVSPRCRVENIRTESLPDGVVGQPYSFRLEHNCSPERDLMEWRVSGNLPPGIMLSLLDIQSSGGQLSGTPTLAGRFSFDVRLVAPALGGEILLESRTFSLVVRAAP